MNDVSWIHESKTDPSRGRRCDPRIDQVELRSFYQALVRLDCPFELLYEGHLRVVLLFRHGILRVKNSVSLQIDSGVCKKRLIAFLLSLCLHKLNLEWTRVDLRYKLAVLNHLPF